MKKLTILLTAAVIAALASSSATAFEGFVIQSPVYTTPSPVIIDPISPPIYDNPFSVENMPGSKAVCIGVSFACIGVSWNVAPTYDEYTNPYFTKSSQEPSFYDKFLGEPKQLDNTYDLCFGVCDYGPIDDSANYPTWPIQPMPSFTHLG